MFCSFYLILYIIWFHFSLSLSPFYYFDYYEHQYFTSVLFHMFSFIKNAFFGSYSWMSQRTFIESSAVTTAFWLDQYGGRFASIFRRCPPSMFWGQWSIQNSTVLEPLILYLYLYITLSMRGWVIAYILSYWTFWFEKTVLRLWLNTGGEGRYIFGNWEKRMGNTYGTRHACVVIARVPSTRAAFVFYPGISRIRFVLIEAIFSEFVCWLLNKCKKK